MPQTNDYFALLVDSKLPEMHRGLMLREMIDPANEAFVHELFVKLEASAAQNQYQEKLKELQAILKDMEEGPKRQGRVAESFKLGGRLWQALIALDDGSFCYATVPDEKLAGELRRGDRVLLEGKGRAVLGCAPSRLKVGEAARFERAIDDQHVEVTIRSERAVLLATADLGEKIKSGQIHPGAQLIINPRQCFAIDALPQEDGLSHFRFLDRGPIPDVIVERDIGAPPKCIGGVARHIRHEMVRASRRRRYHLRRCMMKLLCGASGSGKTLAVQAIHRLMYEIMSEVTGVPIPALPHRVFRVRQSKFLSMWLGESDKNLDRLFDEIETLASQKYRAPDGREYVIPVLVIIEEADGLGRARGHEAIYDRLLTTVLQRLDPNRDELKDKLIIFLATTNEPQIVDAAFLRRVGGSIEYFGRLNQASFKAVLQKHVRDLPAASNNGYTNKELWDRLTADLTHWLFAPNSNEPGLVELTFAGSTNPVIKYRRDFLTGALVDRAVQEAATEACDNEFDGVGSPGITLEQLMRAFNDQLISITNQLREHNVGSYTDLPDGVRVASLRRIPQPARLAIELQRQ